MMNVDGLLAFGAGILSFFSPCVLPLVPSFLIYISGTTVNDYSELSSGQHRKNIVYHSIAFIFGFSLVFIALGLSSSLFLGNILSAYQSWIMTIGGVLLIVMGLNMLNIIKIPFLNQEKMIHLKQKRVGLIGSFVVGVAFSLGWTPCIGPVLSSILLIAATSKSVTSGIYLLGLYSLGLAIPFFIAALLVARLMDFMQRWGHIVKYTSRVLGVLLIIVGLLLLSGYYSMLNAWLMD
jgi:cytochrome c-type biogenesis protein